LCAAPIVENNNVVFVPSNAGVASAVDRRTGKLLWKYKVSNSNIASLIPLDDNKLVVSSVDGKIFCLQF
jgi:outer membrane protein assembly factor BamB